MNWRSACIVACLGACGTETGNPDLVFLGYNARSTDPATVALGEADGDGGALGVESVWLRLGPVRLTGDCDGEPVEATYDALGFADHADPAAVVQELEVRTDTTCRVETSFDVDGAATNEPPDVAGTAVALTGTLADGRAFEILVREPIPLVLALADEPAPAEGSWLLSFDVATWIDASALGALDGDPVIVSADENAGVYGAVVDRLQAGVQLHHDTDDDGQVDPDERRLDAGR